MLFFTCIQPHIDYGLVLWRDAMASNQKPIQSKLKKAIRKISFTKNRHPAEPLFKQHKILNFQKQKTFASSAFSLWTVANKEALSTTTGQFPLKERVYGKKTSKPQTLWHILS